MAKKRLKAFVVAWHLGHQHRLFEALPDIDFYMLKNSVRKWHDHIRPFPKNVKWVSYYEPDTYDFAILHLDQQCSYEKLGKAQLYNALNDLIQDIPKIVINHGSPMLPEYGYDESVVINGGTVVDMNDSKKEAMHLRGIKNMVGDNFMIINSYYARERWGWGYPIIHGMKPDEWFDLPKEPRAINATSPAGMDKYNNRELLKGIKAELARMFDMRLWQINTDIKFMPDGDWTQYRQFLGSSLIYVQQTLDSPMPSARSEAMLSGCCILTSKYHDADLFIENGVNGFILPDNPRSYAEAIGQLIDNYEVAIEIGKRGKETMIKVADMGRYREQWLEVIDHVLKYGTKKAQEMLDKKVNYWKGVTYGVKKTKADKGTA